MLAATRGVVLDVRRVRAPRLPRVAALLLGIGLVAAAPRAEAQSGSPHLSLDRFQPTPGSGRILAIPTSRTMPLWGFAVDLAIDYAKGPLGVANGGDLVAHQLTGQLLAAIGFGPVDLGLAVPATLFQSPGSKAEALLASPIGSASFGDMRLNLKVRLTPQKWIGGLALEAIGQFPTGNGKRFSGEDGYGITARAIGDVTLGRVGLAAYFGYRYRSTAGQLWNLYVSDEHEARG